MKIHASTTFTKMLKKLPLKQQKQVSDALSIFITNPLDARLRNHALIGRRLGTRSIDVGFDMRIIFREKDGTYEIVDLLEVGSHAKLY